MALQTKTFAQVVQDTATAVQGSVANALTDFSVGSILRSVIEAAGAAVMWLQGLILQLLTTTRAATSSGADLDSWMADWGLSRLAAGAASGSVTMARFTPTLSATVPIGAIVQTSDGTQQYRVIADAAQSTYVAGTGYVLAAGTASATVTVQATIPGAAGNAAAAVINALGQVISGIDTVSNGAPFSNGSDAESDANFRARFVNYLSSLSKATKSAIGYAITSLQAGLTYTLTEDYDYSGAYRPGYFYVVVDDGSGSPPSPLLASVTAAIDAVRGAGITFGVFAPTPVSANVAATITTALGYDHAVVAATVQSAISGYIAALPMGANLSWSRLYQIAYDASAGVVEVTSITLNGAMTDLTATAQNAIIPGTVVVT